VKRKEALPLFNHQESWEILWEARGPRGDNWKLVLQYLNLQECSNAWCGHVLNLPGARLGLGGEYHMMTLETECDAAFQEEVDCHLREKGLCVYCMTPWQPSATHGWDDLANEGAAACRHLYRAREVNLAWTEDRFEKKLKGRVLDVRWVGDMFWRWARKESRESGGRFNYFYWVGDDTRWGSERAVSGCLL
jgi:hypothetical protein